MGLMGKCVKGKTNSGIYHIYFFLGTGTVLKDTPCTKTCMSQNIIQLEDNTSIFELSRNNVNKRPHMNSTSVLYDIFFSKNKSRV